LHKPGVRATYRHPLYCAKLAWALGAAAHTNVAPEYLAGLAAVGVLAPESNPRNLQQRRTIQPRVQRVVQWVREHRAARVTIRAIEGLTALFGMSLPRKWAKPVFDPRRLPEDVTLRELDRLVTQPHPVDMWLRSRGGRGWSIRRLMLSIDRNGWDHEAYVCMGHKDTVIEGNHQLDALRAMGATDGPVHRASTVTAAERLLEGLGQDVADWLAELGAPRPQPTETP
jgi:hypothetical protein